MNEAIKLAIEKGGWKQGELQVRTDADIQLDPTFWQALGKALGWQTLMIAEQAREPRHEEWFYHWHRFIDWIAEGKDPEAFWSEILHTVDNPPAGTGK